MGPGEWPFNGDNEQRPCALLMKDDGERSSELHDAADRLIDQSHSLHLAPGENRVPLALFMNAYAEELAFPTIYMGVPRRSSVHVPCRSLWRAARYGAPTGVEQRRSTSCIWPRR
ncbi:hypothetical protein HPB51_024360 [Rhipicephalus microplus]|uniref:Uncharacterized protein n=1 Tax=Rhipicephalus microplus TaxID=6941 RepID=A0A9J6D7I2_RHIMP|nr:hypothetical protein HPB51_024360 [Rhipicephalus microplus]